MNRQSTTIPLPFLSRPTTLLVVQGTGEHELSDQVSQEPHVSDQQPTSSKLQDHQRAMPSVTSQGTDAYRKSILGGGLSQDFWYVPLYKQGDAEFGIVAKGRNVATRLPLTRGLVPGLYDFRQGPKLLGTIENMGFDILKQRYLRLEEQLGELKEENAVLRTNNASLTRMVVEGWARIAPALERATDLEARFEERVSNLEARSFVEPEYY
ncbi:hypothetical protein IWX90DRAFT_413514 [Phyllosticta citrichinensis]|uniref:Uncharacterized protein n=1 Tax=Phyllosticta citrichinensis TaxID=1130410 RepID=A0ABR1Y0Y7_9PEZI